jgi:hypothetical protein
MRVLPPLQWMAPFLTRASWVTAVAKASLLIAIRVGLAEQPKKESSTPEKEGSHLAQASYCARLMGLAWARCMNRRSAIRDHTASIAVIG